MKIRMMTLALLAGGIGMAAVPALGFDLGPLKLNKFIDGADSVIKRAESAVKVGTAVTRSIESFTPLQKHFIGRAVGATVLSRYQPFEDHEALHYLNVLGQALAQNSDQPETYAGYRFLILDTEEINAFAAPGGLIFVTRGLLRCCRSEDALAAVLAHEIGHVQKKHGLQAIRTSRIQGAFATAWNESATIIDNNKLGQLTSTFSDSINDITTAMFNGYSRSAEQEADRDAVIILKRTGYDPNGLVDMLKVMDDRYSPGGQGFSRTHPAPADRIANVREVIGGHEQVRDTAQRQQRFTGIVSRI